MSLPWNDNGDDHRVNEVMSRDKDDFTRLMRLIDAVQDVIPKLRAEGNNFCPAPLTLLALAAQLERAVNG